MRVMYPLDLQAPDCSYVFVIKPRSHIQEYTMAMVAREFPMSIASLHQSLNYYEGKWGHSTLDDDLSPPNTLLELLPWDKQWH